MNRTITYSINCDGNLMTIEQYLKQKGYSRQSLVDLKKMPKSILVDDRHEYLRYVLKEGETLQVVITEEAVSEKILPIELPFPVVYEDEDIVVVNKPADMPIHPSMNNYDNTLANAAAWYYHKQDKPFVFRCINRLDRDTSGLTILAKHMVSSGILYEQMAKREIHREYLAIVENPFEAAKLQGTIDLPIGRKPGSTIERFVDMEQGERAITHYKVIRQFENHALISLHLDTGRTHQIRVHMSYIGHPLVGDWLYGQTNDVLKRQALHSHKLTFIHPITGEQMELVAPLPEDMSDYIKES